MSTNLPLIFEVPWEPYRVYEAHPAARCWVYEVWDTNNRLAYVGIADAFERRWRQHASHSWWLSEINVSRIYVTGYRSRSEARKIEALVINTQSPIYNTNPETRSYRSFLDLMYGDDSELSDECMPVKKRYFKGVGHGETQIARTVHTTRR